MYELYIEAEEFRGKKAVAQHKMVNEVSNEYVKFSLFFETYCYYFSYRTDV
jgi:stress-induced morphogen